MANIITDNKHYTDIANALREKTGESTTYLPSEMATAILNLSAGSAVNMATGTFSAGSSSTTVNVVFEKPLDSAPNLIFFTETDTSYGSSNRTKSGVASTSPVIYNGNASYIQGCICGSTRNAVYQYGTPYPMTVTSGTTGCPIKKATTTGFTACAHSGTYTLKGNYRYIAISF